MSVTFKWPSVNPSDTITLQNPLLGDSDTHDIKTKFKFAMDGGIYSFKQTPAIRRLLLTFNSIDDCGVEFSTYPEIIIFLKAHAGEILQFTDWMGNMWYGIILNNPAELAARNKTFYTLTIQFEGSIQ